MFEPLFWLAVAGAFCAGFFLAAYLIKSGKLVKDE